MSLDKLGTVVIYLSATVACRDQAALPRCFASGFGLAPDKCLPSRIVAKAGRALLPHDFTLTSPKAFAFRRAVYFLLRCLSLPLFSEKAWLLATVSVLDKLGTVFGLSSLDSVESGQLPDI